MRNLIKKPMTDRARKLVVYELQRIKDAGHCPNASLDQSTVHSWADVYPAADKEIATKRSTEYERTQQHLADIKHEEQTPEQRAATADRLRRAKQALRRVA